jgi:hypothetical protein
VGVLCADAVAAATATLNKTKQPTIDLIAAPVPPESADVEPAAEG